MAGVVYRLIGAELSPYTAKVRSYMRFKKIHFEPVISSVEVYREIIKPRVGWSVIPVLLTPDGKALQDSTDIISELERRHPSPSVVPSTPRQKLVSHLLELYGGEWLLLPAMHYRWSFPENKKYLEQEFGRVSFPEESSERQSELANRFYERFEKSVPLLGINEETKGEIEKSFLKLLDHLSAHFEAYPYLLGYRPCVADFTIFSFLYAHLYRDPVPGFIMRSQAPLVAAWLERMNLLVYESKWDVHQVIDGHPVKKDTTEEGQEADSYLANDQIPETVLPILQMMMTEQAPVLVDTAKFLTQFIKENPGMEQLPRAVGEHQFRLGGVVSRRVVIPFCLWMLQHPLDYYAGLAARDRASVDQLLARLPGATALLNLDLSGCRVVRRNNFLCNATTTKSGPPPSKL